MDTQVARRRINIIQGEWKVESAPDVCLTTLLGSCVAACIRDPEVGVGGMNHFLLPGEGGGGSRSESYGLYLMEVLINGLLKKGARRNHLEAKLFGGARTVDGLSDVGAKNAAWAKSFLLNEGINYVGGDLGGDRGRRIEYWPNSGRARQILMDRTSMPRVMPVLQPVKQEPAGDLELF
ncbi:chemotaxis protein CheD [Mangrovibrevibacter kandeliae]|uniref:chemotaxis protein CheD n=1 Tax=Mangrovibrevibacter kandeliae TaxID=2968473 RepID=UPI002119A4FA|nr:MULTISPECIES: chemotaxis protein CheD [unclassified Aurantimonas]MCQ8783924.1 chemotaxis protein CheD [Aurantimonas sp. CSK15Z-1]MCW4116642.1 chemotaxis protein CheD [Aurantimonas sp. MSK8Z-1]